MGLFDKFKKKPIKQNQLESNNLKKCFEDEFMDVQEGMIALCEELASGKDIDEIFVYGSIEEDAVSFNAFYRVQNNTVTASKLSSDIEMTKQFLREGCNDLVCLSEICNEHDKPVPTELRLRYNTGNKHLDTHYEYKPICTINNNLLPSDVFSSWVESVRKELI